MKIKKFVPLIVLVLVLILELLPYGAVLNFADPERAPWRETFSYFSLTPFGFANFGPFITAILTCVMLVLALVYLIKPIPKVLVTWKVVAVIAIAASIAPLIFGLSCYSVIGGLISVLLVAEYFTFRNLKQ